MDEAKNKDNIHVVSVRSDNGKEFINQEVTALFQEYGIVHQTSIPYTPEQNGRIERENRTVVEAARTMLLQSNMKKVL